MCLVLHSAQLTPRELNQKLQVPLEEQEEEEVLNDQRQSFLYGVGEDYTHIQSNMPKTQHA